MGPTYGQNINAKALNHLERFPRQWKDRFHEKSPSDK
jgi:hypothetical protein